MFITLRANADVERIPADRTYKMTEVSEAIRTVHEFLTSFVAASRRNPFPGGGSNGGFESGRLFGAASRDEAQ